MGDEWIVVPNWERFQHYKDRDPPWIKVYPRLLADADYLNLTPTALALLHVTWLSYAHSRGQVMTRQIARTCTRLRPRRAHWKELTDAGFIALSASKPLALRARAREAETEKETPKPPSQKGATITKKELRRFTGCKWVRGTHGATYIPDPLGTDQPPADWPYPKPNLEQVRAALEG